MLPDHEAQALNIPGLSIHDAAHETETIDPNAPASHRHEIVPSAYRPPKARDITNAFNQASAALNQGQLVKDEMFTLFESVSALEIMDPKMDSGCSIPGEDSTVEDFDPLNYTLPEEIIGIIDQMLCFEMAWHAGYPLSQTVFTSLHFNSLLSPDPQTLEKLSFRTRHGKIAASKAPIVNTALRAYCLGLAKCCDLVIRQITNEHYYEEEDFATMTFTRDLLTYTTEHEIQTLLDEALTVVDRLDISSDFKQAISDRLSLRKLLLDAYTLWTLEDEAQKQATMKSALEIIKLLDQSHNMGTPVTAAFSERVQRYLASNTPPRPMVKTNWEEATRQFRQMCNDNMEASRLIKCFPVPSPHAVMCFAWHFTSRKPQPSTYSRAVMQSLLFRNGLLMDTIPHLDILISDMREVVMAGDALFDPTNWQIELPSDPRYQVARKIDDFVNKALDEYLNLYRMALQNRCRIRRTFVQSIPILDALQAVAEEIDSDILTITRSASPTRFSRQEPLGFYPLSAWVFLHKLRAMECTLQLGFELSVYQRDELAGMYGLLAHISQTRHSHLRHIFIVLTNRHKRLSRTKDPTAIEVEQTLAFLTLQSAQATLTTKLASALRILFTLINVLPLIATPPRPYGTHAMRHELRLKPFLSIGTPSLPSPSDLHSLTHPAVETTITSLSHEAEEHLKEAKKAGQTLRAARADEARIRGVENGWMAEVKTLMLCCVAAGVAVAGVKTLCADLGVQKVGDLSGDKAAEVSGRLKEKVELKIPELEDKERWHAWWIVPKLVMK